MTPLCKKVLNELLKLSEYSDEPLIYVWGHDRLCLSSDLHKFYDFSVISKEFDSVISHLVKEDYLEYTDNGIKLTHKGLHYQMFNWIEFKRFMTNSILVPVAVSFFTSLLLHLLF